MCCYKGYDFFQTLIGRWLKKSLKQTNFGPPKLKTKHLVLSPKTIDLFFLPQTLEIALCTPNLKPSKHDNSHEKFAKYPKHLLLPLMHAFVIEHMFPKLPMDPSMMWHLC
jgi:hypothetical protein